jgi:hypothetical protein
MADVIRILALDEDEAHDLSDALARHGLSGGPRHIGEKWEVDLALRYEKTSTLVADVVQALETWLDDHRRAAVRLRVGSHGYLFESRTGLTEDALGN